MKMYLKLSSARRSAEILEACKEAESQICLEPRIQALRATCILEKEESASHHILLTTL